MKKINTHVKVAIVCCSILFSTGTVFGQLNDNYPTEVENEKPNPTPKNTESVKGISTKPDSLNQPENVKPSKEEVLQKDQKTDGALVKPTQSTKNKEESDKDKIEETKSPVSYNFFYYIIQKFRFSGFFGE